MWFNAASGNPRWHWIYSTCSWWHATQSNTLSISIMSIDAKNLTYSILLLSLYLLQASYATNLIRNLPASRPVVLLKIYSSGAPTYSSISKTHILRNSQLKVLASNIILLLLDKTKLILWKWENNVQFANHFHLLFSAIFWVLLSQNERKVARKE